MDFPTRDEEYRILRGKLDGPSDDLIRHVIDILQQSHSRDEDLSIRDGLNIARYAHRLIRSNSSLMNGKPLTNQSSKSQEEPLQLMGQTGLT
jgi:hypothetical protein